MTSVGAKLNKFFSLRTAEARSHIIEVETKLKLIFCLTTGDSWISRIKFIEERKKRKKSFYDTGTMNSVRTSAWHN